MFEKGMTLQAFINELRSAFEKEIKDYDLWINTTPLYSPLLIGDICYVHYPMIHEYVLTSSSFFERLYGNSLVALGKLIRRSLRKRFTNPFLIFNSDFTRRKTSLFLKRIIAEEQDFRSTVIYPPVEVREIIKRISKKKYERERLVVLVSRIDPVKELERVIKLAKGLPGTNFAVVGRLTNKHTKYYKDLLRKTEKEEISNIFFYPNAKEGTKLDLLNRGEAYLHLMKNEHFGVSIIEGMAAGLIPIVHDSGGPREFIPERWRYRSMAEAKETIERALSGWTPEISKKFSKRAGYFDKNNFRKKIKKVLASQTDSS